MDKATMDDIYALCKRLNVQSVEQTGDPRVIPFPDGDNDEWGVRLCLWGMSPLEFLNLDDCGEWLTSQLV